MVAFLKTISSLAIFVVISSSVTVAKAI